MLLSELPKLGYVVRDPMTDRESYWAGSRDWETCIDHPAVITVTEERSAAILRRCYPDEIILNTFVEADRGVDVIKVNGKWVVGDRNKGELLEVKVALSYGKGFYIKDMGTIENTICLNNGAEAYFDISFKGDTITKVESKQFGQEWFFIPAGCQALNFFRTGDPVKL